MRERVAADTSKLHFYASFAGAGALICRNRSETTWLRNVNLSSKADLYFDVMTCCCTRMIASDSIETDTFSVVQA